jgi:hypothetical protein
LQAEKHPDSTRILINIKTTGLLISDNADKKEELTLIPPGVDGLAALRRFAV